MATIMERRAADRPWLKSYPPGVPAEANIDAFASIRDILLKSCREFASLPAFTNMDATIDYASEDLKDRIRELTGGKGADVVFDPVGGAYAEPALRSIAWRGRYLVVGFANGEIPRIPLNLPLLNDLDVDGFFMEFDDDRSGGFEPLRFLPKGKIVVLGLVTTKRGALERKDELKRRIEEASRFVDIDQLCLSPQCGFSSTVEGNSLTEAEQLAKLRLVVETAHEVWGA